MLDRYDVVVVGGGRAGASCVEALREAGSSATVALFASEEHAPYNRPPLTKGFVRGELQEDDTLVEPEAWYAEHDVDLYTGSTVAAIEPESARVRLSDGRVVGYDTLVLATGAEPRVPKWKGDGDTTDRVFTIRTLEDSERVRAHLQPGSRWIVVGGGYVGVETAASACLCGCEVDLVMQEPVLWQQFYGQKVGLWFESRLEDQGVRIHPDDEVVRLDVTDDGVRVQLDSGAHLEGDFVLAGIGVVPRLELARDAGLEVDAGVLCDQQLRTSDPRIFAVGDIAQYDSVVHGQRMRIEHWDVARQQGRYVGRLIAGALDDPAAPYDEVPYFFSKLGDWASMRYVGPGMGDVVIRGDMDRGKFAAAYLKDGRLVALLAVDHDEDLETARRLLPDHPLMDAALLADDSVSLAEAVR